MKLSLLLCLMFSTTALCGEGGLPFWEHWLQLFKKWIPKNTDVDVMMLLDSSSSVGNTNFNKGKKGIQYTNIMVDIRTPSGINGQLNGTRSGYIQFASIEDTSIVIHLPDFDNVGDLNDEIDSQIYTGGKTAMAKALQRSAVEFFHINPNPGQPKRVLLVTDGKETEGGVPQQVAVNLKRPPYGVEICVVAIGNNVDMPVLNSVATKYQFGHLMHPCVAKVKSWRKFKKGIRKAARILRKGKGN